MTTYEAYVTFSERFTRRGLVTSSVCVRIGRHVVPGEQQVSRRSFVALGAAFAGVTLAALPRRGAYAAALAPERDDGRRRASVPARLSTAPAYSGDFPDPFLLRVDERYFAYATQSGRLALQVMRSKDLGDWTRRREALPELPSWAQAGHTWAPAVLARPEGYVLYYAVRHRASGLQCISAAVAATPDGPFVDRSSEPLIFQQRRGGSIDPSPFVDDGGRAFLVWKSDDNALRRPTSLWGARLRSDGLALDGPTTKLLSQDAAWEKPVIEGPALIRVGATYYLFYGGGWWESSRAAIGYATAGDALGPYVKATRRQPWLASRPGAAGPGGPQFFTDDAGQMWMAYHAWEPGSVGYAKGGVRSLWLDRIGFTAERPVLGLETSDGA